VVHQGEQIFEKPADDADAARMLACLSGNGHAVTTAWCLRRGGANPVQVQGHQTSAVYFRTLTAVEIARYIATGEGSDKAGGYAIQGDGASLITKVEGSTTNVIGLPLEDVLPALADAGLKREEA
jgi:septum formation protein